MAQTANQLITSAMRLLGAVASGEAATANELADGLTVLNDLLDSWNNKGLIVFANENDTYNLIANQQDYSIGPSGGDFTATRPVGIEGAFVTYNSLDFPLKLLNQQEWNAIALKSFAAPIPNSLYYVAEYPNGKLHIWPKPSAAIPLTLSVNMQFTALSTGASSIAYPPGYSKALRYCLAVDLSAEFKIPLPKIVEDTAISELADIQGVNLQQQVSTFDPALTGGGTVGIAGFLGGYW